MAEYGFTISDMEPKNCIALQVCYCSWYKAETPTHPVTAEESHCALCGNIPSQ